MMSEVLQYDLNSFSPSARLVCQIKTGTPVSPLLLPGTTCLSDSLINVVIILFGIVDLRAFEFVMCFVFISQSLTSTTF